MFYQDLDQIEEWNEYGELKDQIAATQDFGTFTAPTSTLAPELPTASTASTPQRSGPPSRASSETRHISIAEPAEKNDGDGKSKASQKSAESPMNIAMKQLGAEAAAKAAQKKAGVAVQTSRAVVAPVAEKSVPDQTSSSASSNMSSEAALDSADTAARVTAAKTPAQLASEGAGRTSVDKIAESDSGAPVQEQTTSTEAQQLEMRRTSSVTNTKSRLSEITPITESHTVAGEPASESQPQQDYLAKPSSSIAIPDGEVGATRTDRLRQHRGSDIVEADIEEIRAMEKKLSIPEESDEDDDDTGTAAKVSATHQVEKAATKGINPQDADPKDVDSAGVSVGD